MKTNEVRQIEDYPSALTVQDLTEILSVSSRTVYKLLKDGVFPSVPVGRELRIPKKAVMKYLLLDDEQGGK